MFSIMNSEGTFSTQNSVSHHCELWSRNFDFSPSELFTSRNYDFSPQDSVYALWLYISQLWFFPSEFCLCIVTLYLAIMIFPLRILFMHCDFISRNYDFSPQNSVYALWLYISQLWFFPSEFCLCIVALYLAIMIFPLRILFMHCDFISRNYDFSPQNSVYALWLYISNYDFFPSEFCLCIVALYLAIMIFPLRILFMHCDFISRNYDFSPQNSVYALWLYISNYDFFPSELFTSRNYDFPLRILSLHLVNLKFISSHYSVYISQFCRFRLRILSLQSHKFIS